MSKKSVTSAIILAILGVIFYSDSILLSLGFPTYSEVITGLLRNEDDSIDWTNLTVFISSVALLCTHWIFGYYKKINKK